MLVPRLIWPSKTRHSRCVRSKARLGISYGRANALIGQLTNLGILYAVDEKAYKRIFFAPRVIDVLTAPS